jgi:hypothetical protein
VGVSIFKRIARGAKKGVKTAGKLAKNPLVKAAAGGLAFVVPPVGIGLVAVTNAKAIAGVANNIVKGSKSKDPKKKAAATAVIKSTAALAAQGDVGAQRAVQALKLSHASGGNLKPKPPVRAVRPAPTARGRVSASASAKPKWHVYADGRVVRA